MRNQWAVQLEEYDSMKRTGFWALRRNHVSNSSHNQKAWCAKHWHRWSRWKLWKVSEGWWLEHHGVNLCRNSQSRCQSPLSACKFPPQFSRAADIGPGSTGSHVWYCPLALEKLWQSLWMFIVGVRRWEWIVLIRKSVRNSRHGVPRKNRPKGWKIG